ncbi:MAG TPA: WbqC family protein [Nitrospiraceae bacterium]|nr:WbqC family protein [Nitrospiraceae bacterium]
MANNAGTVAIMQPYFFPYGGYFRLLTRSEIFVIYDCVQFPRRGWVHRNKLKDLSGAEQWLTLPLVKQERDVLIKDLVFPEDAPRELAERLRPFPLPSPDPEWRDEVLRRVLATGTDVVDYLEEMLQLVAVRLGRTAWNVCRSSSFNIPQTLRGQDRIIEIARRTGAKRYLNAPGGVGLYDKEKFAESGLELEFLPDYDGPFDSMLGRILAENPDSLAQDIL